MKKMLQYLLRNMRLGQQLSAAICIFALIPTFILGLYIINNTQNLLVQTRRQSIEEQAGEISQRVEKGVELCNMSTQVFLNTPDLVNYLDQLKRGENMQTQRLIAFYHNDIASLEKVVMSNPYLYQIRAYSTQDGIQEMMPILYSRSRMNRMQWAKDGFISGTWQLNFDDQLFDSYPVTPHVASLVTNIETPEDGTVGVLEAAVKLDTLMPELFAQTHGQWAGLVGRDGNLIAGDTGSAPQQYLLQQWTGSQGTSQQRNGKEQVLVSVIPLPDFGCTYIQMNSLADIQGEVLNRASMTLMTLMLSFLVLMLLVNVLTRRMLRGYYNAFNCVREFSEGNLDATMVVTGSGEMARFETGIQEMLENIRRLMQSNMERKLLIKDTEIRALQNQINAHFIYNVLESIKMMAEIDENYELADAVTNLGKLLRYSMRWNKRNVSLLEELDYTGNYVALMNLRFDYEIRLEKDVPEDLLQTEVPKISIQPIVENAIIHAAVSAAEGDRIIRVHAFPEGTDCVIEVTDNGPGMEEAQISKMERQIEGLEETRSASGNGIGLKNVQDRLHMTYGVIYGITVRSQLGTGTTVSIRVPFKAQQREDLK